MFNIHSKDEWTFSKITNDMMLRLKGKLSLKSRELRGTHSGRIHMGFKLEGANLKIKESLQLEKPLFPSFDK